MGFDTVFNRSCPNRIYITSNKRHENSSRCEEAWTTVWEAASTQEHAKWSGKTTLQILRTNRHTRGRQELSSVWGKMYEMSKVQSLQFCVQVQGPIQQQEMVRAKTRPQASRKSRTQAPRQENYWRRRRCWQLNKFEWWALLPSRKAPEVKKIKADGEDKTVSVKIIDVDVRAEPDSGAEVNVLDEHQFKALTNRSSVKLTLQPTE